MTLFTTAYTLPDGKIEIVRRPGVPMPGAATEALIQAAPQIPPGAQVLVMGPGATATAVWAARHNATLTHWTENIAEAQSLTATFERNHLTPPRAYLQADFKGLRTEDFDLVLLHLPRGHSLQEETLKLAAAVLKPGGQLVFVGAKREGVKSALKLAKTIFGRAGIVIYKGSYHAGRALRPKNKMYTIPELTYQTYEVVLNDTPIPLVSCTGVFAENRLDNGAAALIVGMKIETGARVLDLGCGTGVVGLMARRQGAEVMLVDVSARAVVSTRRTLNANGYTDTECTLSCGTTEVRNQTFDIVVTNPPFHTGHSVDLEVAQNFIEGAARILRKGGYLYLVANAFLKYGHWLEDNFTKTNIAWENKHYKVWKSTK